MHDRRPHTHIAYAQKREGRTSYRWVEIGIARIESDGKDHDVYIDRLPIGGFTGRIHLSPVGTKPEAPPARPAHSGQTTAEEEF